jgi:peptide/nickel transport system substrate-binding protein
VTVRARIGSGEGEGKGWSRRGTLKTAGAGAMVAAMTGIVPEIALAQYGSTQGKEFHGAYPYDVPPVGHYNTFPGIPRSMAVGIYRDLMEMPLGMYYWASGTWMPLLATSWETFRETSTLQVKLRQGVKWSDGTTFSARDVLNTFTIRRLLNLVEWRYLDRIDAPDEYTVNFVMAKPTTTMERYVLRTNISATSNFGDWANKVRTLVNGGATSDSDDWKKLRQEFTDFKPKGMITNGPFQIDPKSITDSQLTLTKVPTSWLSSKIQFDKVVLYNGETPTVTPIVLSREVDYATHGFPPATEKAFKDLGFPILRPPTYAGPALYFNYAKMPAIAPKAVRQAIAHAIKREIGAAVALGESAEPPKYMVGFSDRLVPLWLSPETVDKLNRYEFDLDKAEALMRGAGYTRAADRVWTSPNGERMEYEITVPGEFADNSALAQAAAEQLTTFGIKTSVRLIAFQQLLPDTNEGRFQMVIQGWGSANPHPHFSFVQNLMQYNTQIAPGPGMAYPLIQNVEALGGEVDLEAMTVAAAEGLDIEGQKTLVNQLSLAYNELLPNIPMYERLGNNPAPNGIRVTGWPAANDPIYQNSPYADSFTVMLILDGKLRPV